MSAVPFRRCPSCEVNVGPMDLTEFAAHQKVEHPELHALIASALATFESREEEGT